MLTIWGRRNSFNVQKVMWLIGELAISHNLIPTGGEFGGLDTPEFLEMNPHGRVPVIRDKDNITWESHAILRYLAASYGNNTSFWSNEPGMQSRADQWMDWAQTRLQPDFLDGIFWAFYRTPKSQRNLSLIKENIKKCNKHFLLLDKILGKKPFLGGSTITLADVPAGTSLYRYFELEIERPALPNVEAWYKRMQERPAYREHVMIPFDDMFGRLEY